MPAAQPAEGTTLAHTNLVPTIVRNTIDGIRVLESVRRRRSVCIN